MKIIVTGATGLIGAEVTRQAVANVEVDEVITIARSRPPVTSTKLRFVQHNDFNDFSALGELFQDADALIWALGISQTQVSKAEYIAITYDYVMACAKQCLISNPATRFVFVSGNGADITERSSTIFRRIKGKAENGLNATGLNVFIARPDAVRPIHKNKKAPFLYKLAYPFFPLIELFAPSKIIWSDTLAKALLKIAMNKANSKVCENPELRELGK
jgi:uncharacterized protein YbjT (DUF2867 family)